MSRDAHRIRARAASRRKKREIQAIFERTIRQLELQSDLWAATREYELEYRAEREAQLAEDRAARPWWKKLFG